MRRKCRVFIGPCEIAGYYENLTKGFREIGVECDYITFVSHPFGYGGETHNPAILRLAKFLKKLRGKPGRSIVVKILMAFSSEVLFSVWALFAIFKYDVFIFGFGESLLRKNIDLSALRLLGKKVIINMAHGSEARPPYINGAYQGEDGCLQPTLEQLIRYSKAKRNKVRLVDKYSNIVIGAPFSTAHFASKKFINHFSLGLPFYSLRQESFFYKSEVAVKEINTDRPVRILHAPSNVASKGSKLIYQAIVSLKKKGYEVELVLINGKSHDEVINAIQECDFVVDQVYSDTPMAGFATEAAWFGKPAVVGGYGLEYLKSHVPAGMWPPSKICNPNNIEQAIEYLIVNSEERLRLGTQAQNFVRNNWNSAAVASRYLKLIEGIIPDEWWLDPSSVTYLEGAGQPVERSKENIRQLVNMFGVESLQLGHRPELERAFLEFADLKALR